MKNARHFFALLSFHVFEMFYAPFTRKFTAKSAHERTPFTREGRRVPSICQTFSNIHKCVVDPRYNFHARTPVTANYTSTPGRCCTPAMNHILQEGAMQKHPHTLSRLQSLNGAPCICQLTPPRVCAWQEPLEVNGDKRSSAKSLPQPLTSALQFSEYLALVCCCVFRPQERRGEA